MLVKIFAGHGRDADGARKMNQTTQKLLPPQRSEFPRIVSIQTRWADNDVYGHVNNVVYYSWFDTVVNRYLIEKAVLDITRSSVIGLVVETRCNYFSSLAFPQRVEAGLRVSHIGRSSVRYEIALFAEHAQQAAAFGHFVHVYVERATWRPVPLPSSLRQALQEIAA